MAQFQEYNKLLVSKSEGIENIRSGERIIGYRFYGQYPSYRGTYLSCIEELHIFVDGQQICDRDIFFEVNGKQMLLSQLKDLYLEYWFILDKASYIIAADGGIAPGEHRIKVSMKHRIPYTGYFGTYLSLLSEDEKVLTLCEKEALV